MPLASQLVTLKMTRKVDKSAYKRQDLSMNEEL